MPWSSDKKFDDHVARYAIGLVTLTDSRLLCVHRGNNNNLWWTIYDPAKPDEKWSKDQELPDHAGVNGASCALYKGVAHCVYRGGPSDDWLYLTTFDSASKKWSSRKRLGDHRSCRNPAIAPYKDSAGKEWLFCVHRGWEPDDRLWFTKYDGNGWTTDELLSNDGHRSWSDPALCAYKYTPPGETTAKTVLFCVHRGKVNDDDLYWCVFDGQWSKDTRLGGHNCGGDADERGSVAIAADDKNVYCVHRGALGNNHLWETTFNGSTWSRDEELANHYGRFVSLSKRGSVLYCVHGGGGDNSLWWMEKSVP